MSWPCCAGLPSDVYYSFTSSLLLLIGRTQCWHGRGAKFPGCIFGDVIFVQSGDTGNTGDFLGFAEWLLHIIELFGGNFSK